MIERIYLDTSIPSAYFDERDKKRQKITQQWWKEVLVSKYKPYISELVESELGDTKNKRRQHELLGLVKSIESLEITEEAEELAKAYLDDEIIPEEYIDDAIHLAIATINNIGVVASWKFAHLVNHETKKRVRAINVLKGYREIEIESPLELGGEYVQD